MTPTPVDPNQLVQEGSMEETCPKCKAMVFEGQCNCPSDAELAAAEETKADEGPAKEEDAIEAPFKAKTALEKLPGSPSKEQIDQWKASYGSVYTIPFDEKEIYIWRPIRLAEWRMLQSNEALTQQEAKFQEQIVLKAVLWPQLDPIALNTSRAGLIPTLYSVIMQGSYFLHPDFAIQLVEEL